MFIRICVLFFIGIVSQVNAEEERCNLWQGKCPPGWKSFIRSGQPPIRVCLKIFSRNATYLDAQEVCRKQYNSRIHGVGTLNEHLWLKIQISKVIKAKNAFMWIGARRKSYCYDTAAKLASKPECKKHEQFDWDDQLTQDGYLFTQWDKSIDAPNGVMSNGAPEDCVVMNVDTDATIDDKDCTIPQQGFLCGMTA